MFVISIECLASMALFKTLKHSFSKDFSDGEAKIYERQASYFLRQTTNYTRR